jgi:Domain of unknown function (DUF4278)
MTTILQKQCIEKKVIKLIYRGTTYNYDPDLVSTNFPTQSHKSAFNLIYRGSTYRFDPTLASPDPVISSSYKLIYRGCTYQVHRNEQGEVIRKSTSY